MMKNSKEIEANRDYAKKHYNNATKIIRTSNPFTYNAIEDYEPWRETEYDLPPKGREIIGFRTEWILEDYNPNGTRLCFYGDFGWTTARWCNDQDSWYTDNSEDDKDGKETIPTHWKPKPKHP
ncbi:hypothetical protein LCGC14_0246180 [marine sediment metagenome]|uniref:DUF551 domain-containing protein n=1 Tax=marine sediment metagenome TaxID=412755 RepID=A0A0F9UMJ8_9ZZZZ